MIAAGIDEGGIKRFRGKIHPQAARLWQFMQKRDQKTARACAESLKAAEVVSSSLNRANNAASNDSQGFGQPHSG